MGYRQCDSHGCGHYKASRGSRKHNGQDLCNPGGDGLTFGRAIIAGFKGEVVKIGRAYSDEDKAHLKYVAIKLGEFYCRIFYINPTVIVGDKIEDFEVIGISQSLGEIYPGITERIHVEFYTLINPNKSEHNKKNFQYVDPRVALEVMR
ncbi:MAG: hypothetical protein V3U58_03860 [Thermodesulfobacteriota bacterium]